MHAVFLGLRPTSLKRSWGKRGWAAWR